MSIESELFRIKKWYQDNWPLCVFCNHRVDGGTLAHLIRRSESIRLQTIKLNTGLAHFECHEIFDNKPGEAICLPRFFEVMYVIWLLDPQYYSRILPIYSGYDFDLHAVEKLSLDHHGELLLMHFPTDSSSEEAVILLHSKHPILQD